MRVKIKKYNNEYLITLKKGYGDVTNMIINKKDLITLADKIADTLWRDMYDE